jgi:hypothetical protein
MEVASTCERLRRRRRPPQLGPGRGDRQSAPRTQHATALAQHADRVGEEEEDDGHRHCCELASTNGIRSALPSTTSAPVARSRASWTISSL